MKLKMIREDFVSDILINYDVEVAFPIFISFRNFMLTNPDQVQINRPEPITNHEIKVGGAKTNGRNNTVVVTMPRSALDVHGFKFSPDILWELLVKAVETGYASPDPKRNCGSTYSIFQNIANMTNDSVTFKMNCWLPDFGYFDELKKAGKPKYSAQHIDRNHDPATDDGGFE